MAGEVWVNQFPELEGWYWVDDGKTVGLMYAEFTGGHWIAWDPMESHENHDVRIFVRWTRCPLTPLPMPDEIAQ